MVKRFGGPARTRIIRPDQIDDVSLEAMLDEPRGRHRRAVRRHALRRRAWSAASPSRAPSRRRSAATTCSCRGSPPPPLAVWRPSPRRPRARRPAPRSPRSPGARGASPCRRSFTTQKGETVLTLVTAPAARPERDDLLAATTRRAPSPSSRSAQKRVSAPTTSCQHRQHGKTVIGLKPGDTVVAAFEAPDDARSSSSRPTPRRCASTPPPCRCRAAAPAASPASSSPTAPPSSPPARRTRRHRAHPHRPPDRQGHRRRRGPTQGPRHRRRAHHQVPRRERASTSPTSAPSRG